VNDWLPPRADRLAEATGVPRDQLELAPDAIDRLLDLAGFAAHSSGERTNAPLLCFLVGLAQGASREGAAEGLEGLEELDRIVRSTS
jgi:hypothetical protein